MWFPCTWQAPDSNYACGSLDPSMFTVLVELTATNEKTHVNVSVPATSLYTFVALSCDPQGSSVYVDYHFVNPGGA